MNSTSQKIVNLNKIILEGNVEVLVDTKLHIWADKVEIDKEKQTVVAFSEFGFVKLETNDFLMLADRIFLDLEKKTGGAENVKLHMDGRFISAKRAEKVSEKMWRFKDVIYTACDEVEPHWYFKAGEAKLYKYLIKGKDLLLKIGKIPVFAMPRIVIPAQSQTKSGFLMPRFSVDKRLGIGFRQEYYWELASRLDTTIGLNWKQKKGYLLYDEFRWGRGQDDYTLINTQIAKEKNAYREKDSRITQGKDWRYSFQGYHFQPFKFKGRKFDNLIKIDFGTDKRIGYDFLGKTDAVEDRFVNTFISRLHTKEGLVSLEFDRDKIFRENFTFLERKKEIEERLVRSRLPHLEWNSILYSLGRFFNYRNDIFIDREYLNRRKIEKVYRDSDVISVSEVFPKEKADTVRIFYEGILQKALKTKNNHVFRFYLAPNFQVRGATRKVKRIGSRSNSIEGRFGASGAYRIFLQSGLEWAFPEYVAFSDDYDTSYFMQPLICWKYIPKIQQNHWYHVDHWDRVYPKNRVEVILRNNWYFPKGYFELVLNQGLEFYNKSDIFPFVRPVYQKHFLPFKVDASLNYDLINLHLLQEYNFERPTLLQSEIGGGVVFGKFDMYLSWLYQSPELQRERDLLADLPSFCLFGIGLQANKSVKVSYEGQFYSKHNSFVSLLHDIDALCHRADVRWKGHCWGILFGLEERRYRQQGVIKSERGFVFSLKLDSLGSFASRFKQEPRVLDAPSGY